MKKTISLLSALVFTTVWNLSSAHATTQIACTTSAGAATTVASIAKANKGSHLQSSDLTLGTVKNVVLSGAGYTITAAGSYRFTGKITSGKISVNTAEAGNVQIVLAGVDIKNPSGSAIEVLKAAEVVILLEAGSKNILTDGTGYDAKLEPNAVIYSKAALTIGGTGSLSVTGNFEDGITSKDGLVINSGVITVTAKDDAIRGKDFVIVNGGTLALSATGGDGIKSDAEKVAGAGYVAINGGKARISAKDDGIQGNTDVVIAKGTIAIGAADDGINATCEALIANGTVAIASNDDGIHSDGLLMIAGGKVTITQSYEALEAGDIYVKGGVTSTKSSDDGVNVVAVTASSAEDANAFLPKTGATLNVSGGTLKVSADGDGLDVNGSAYFTGGTTVVQGPTANNNAALDVDNTFTITKGTLIGIGSSGMAMAPATTSAQATVKFALNTIGAANSKIQIVDSSGSVIYSVTSSKTFASIVFSSASIAKGQTYTLKIGGSSASTAVAGSYTNSGPGGGGPGGGGMRPTR